MYECIHYALVKIAACPDVVGTQTFLEASLHLYRKFAGLSFPVSGLRSVHGIFHTDNHATLEERLQIKTWCMTLRTMASLNQA